MQHVLTERVLRVQVVQEDALLLLQTKGSGKQSKLALRLVVNYALIVGLGIVLARL